MFFRQASLLVLALCHAGAWTSLSLPSRSRTSIARYATLAPPEDIVRVSNEQHDSVLETMKKLAQEAKAYADDFGMAETEAAVYAFFAAIKQSKTPLALKGEPFVLRSDEIRAALDIARGFDGFYTLGDFAQAVQDDFLDAARGSTDNRKGWKIASVSEPRGESFEDARMTFEEVEAALEKGTVILNAIGAHIPKLAAPNLACTDATSLPNAINLYVTAAGKRTSAPPHTDKQDVAIVQTAGSKQWRVFKPTDPAKKPSADVFARGKGDDNLPLHQLLDEDQSQPNSSELLIETVLNAGDVLFIPAAFPHTTSTARTEETSVHLTFNIDSHVWELDYLSARRLALRRAGVVDTALGQTKPTDNRYEGRVNELPADVRADLLGELPLGLLEDESGLAAATAELKRISTAVDETTASAVDDSVWEETMARLRQQGVELLETHRDMYLAAIQEGRTRDAEAAMTAHLEDDGKRKTMSPERIQRLSCFRVKGFYERVDESKKSLLEWSQAGASASGGGAAAAPALSADWAFSLPIKVGDQVEADLGGAFFDATVTRASGGTYDVQFFDGDRDVGLSREMLKLKSPPAVAEEVDTSSMTPKQLKRWRKQQEKKKQQG